MLVDNIIYLREKYPYIREKLKDVEDRDIDFFIEETRRGEKTLLYKKFNKKTYIHSKYDPLREANALIEEYKEFKNETIIFYGTGLGYHIDLLMKENPDNNYYIFEPIPQLLEKFLSVRNLTNKQYKNLRNISLGLEHIELEIPKLISISRKNIKVIELPTHKQIFNDEFKNFNKVLLNIVKNRRTDMLTNYGFQRRWIINSMKNFKEILNTPNILLEKKNEFKGKPALLVAAGPSLNYEIEKIKYIKENGLAYIISVGSAINTLIQNNIYPHAATTYDPGEFNQKVFEKIKEKNITDIPLIFGSSVGFETIENYPGKKYHMITSQDKVSNFFLEDEEEIDIVLDAPTIAVVTLQLLYCLGFQSIILVGQNLAYLGQDEHSSGVDYSTGLTEAKLKNTINVKNVNGEDILTSEGYNKMRLQMESYISQMPKGQVINTTKNGARIEGAKFIELDKVIKENLNKKVFDKDWLQSRDYKYEKQNLRVKINEMDMAVKESKNIVKEYVSILDDLSVVLKNKYFNKIYNLYKELNIVIGKLEVNVFFTTFILQINRVEYRLLSESVNASSLESDIYIRNSELLNSYKIFIEKCNRDIDFIMPFYEDMKENIINYIK